MNIKFFSIIQSVSGAHLCLVQADDEQKALEALARKYGFSSVSDLLTNWEPAKHGLSVSAKNQDLAVMDSNFARFACENIDTAIAAMDERVGKGGATILHAARGFGLFCASLTCGKFVRGKDADELLSEARLVNAGHQRTLDFDLEARANAVYEEHRDDEGSGWLGCGRWDAALAVAYGYFGRAADARRVALSSVYGFAHEHACNCGFGLEETKFFCGARVESARLAMDAEFIRVCSALGKGLDAYDSSSLD